MKEASHKRPQIILFHLYDISKLSKSAETESRLVFAKSWGGWLVPGMMAKLFLFELMKCSKTVVMATPIHEYSRTLDLISLKGPIK